MGKLAIGDERAQWRRAAGVDDVYGGEGGR